MPVNTPNVAQKINEFTVTQLSYNKQSLELNGRNIFELTYDTTYHNATIELQENYYYFCRNITLISDGQIIKDSQNNEYEVFIYNGIQLLSDTKFGIEIKNTFAYLYPLEL